MPSGTRSGAALLMGLAALLTSGAAWAQAGTPCVGDTCGLGGFQRAQIGQGLPIPITLQPAQSGQAFQLGGILATPSATVMQQDPAPATGPRSLMVPTGVFTYDGPQVSQPVFLFNPQVFAVRTDLNINNPRAAGTFAAGGRPGPATVSWCVGSPLPMAGFNPGCLGPATRADLSVPDPNGIAIYQATAAQFGGTSGGLTTGTAQVFLRPTGVTPPCTGGAACRVAISLVTPASESVFGDEWGATAPNPADMNPTGVWTASIGPAGTVMLGTPLTLGGGTPIPFTGQAATSWGLPLTTGRIILSVTQNAGAVDEIFTRTGFDTRDANGTGVVQLVSGTLSKRTISGPNANRGWLTMVIPEPGAIAAGAVALLVLGGCHLMMRRRG